MKWRDYRRGMQENVPADLGGKRIHITEESMEKLQQALAQLNLCKPSDGFVPNGQAIEEKELFRQLLQSDDATCARIIKDRLNISRADQDDADRVQRRYHANRISKSSDTQGALQDGELGDNALTADYAFSGSSEVAYPSEEVKVKPSLGDAPSYNWD